jgi:hypothetical protein
LFFFSRLKGEKSATLTTKTNINDNNNNPSQPTTQATCEENNTAVLINKKRSKKKQQQPCLNNPTPTSSSSSAWRAFTANYVTSATPHEFSPLLFKELVNSKNSQTSNQLVSLLKRRMDEMDSRIIESTYLKKLLVDPQPSHGHFFDDGDVGNNATSKFDFTGLVDVIDLTKLCSGGSSIAVGGGNEKIVGVSDSEFHVPPPPLQFSDGYQNNNCKFLIAISKISSNFKQK